MRRDIQSLRGIAVLLVLAYHADIGLFSRGFLGVDVFFVISGFLITGMITRELDAGRFKFREFYWRRAKRLLPAAYVVLGATSVAALLLLTRMELRAYVDQVIGAVSFSANIVLWRQTGYFDGAAELKPLLHTWSLSLEEQFYLVLPLLLWLTPGRRRKPVIIAALLASLGLCLALAPARPSAAFYLLPTRAWELLLGAVGALWFDPSPAPASTGRRIAGVASIAAVLTVSTVALDATHPRLDAAAVCLATLIAIWARPSVLERGPAAELLARAGDVSYSLYLVHWPVFAFARNVYLDAVPPSVKVAGVIASLGMAAILYRYVEDPLRQWKVRPSPRMLWIVAASSAAIVLLPLSGLGVKQAKDWSEIRRANLGLGPECEYGSTFTLKPGCRTSDRAKMLVWGDSFAMHLMPGLAASDQGIGLLQATRSNCGPTLGVATMLEGETRAKDCVAFNTSVLSMLAQSPDLDYVVLASPYELYIDPASKLWTDSGISAAGGEIAIKSFVRTIEALRSVGKKVVLVAPPPSTGVDFANCVERTQTGLLTFGRSATPDCTIDERTYRTKKKNVIALLDRIAEAANVNVVSLSDMLCNGTTCQTTDGGIPLFRDKGHLSYAGSEVVARKYHLLERLVSAAR